MELKPVMQAEVCGFEELLYLTRTQWENTEHADILLTTKTWERSPIQEHLLGKRRHKNTEQSDVLVSRIRLIRSLTDDECVDIYFNNNIYWEAISIINRIRTRNKESLKKSTKK